MTPPLKAFPAGLLSASLKEQPDNPDLSVPKGSHRLKPTVLFFAWLAEKQ